MDEPTTPARTTSLNPVTWIALTVTVIALLASIAWPIAAVFIYRDFQDSQDDFEGMEMGGRGYYVEDEGVIEAVEEPCEAMVESAEKLNLVGSNAKVAASLKGWAETAGGIVTAIDEADPDNDSEEWRDDWKATIAAVNKYADNLGKPNNRLTLPDSAGQMYWSTDAECGVPISIASLDRRYAGQMLSEDF
jgi:hypothetical protein